MYHIFLVWTEQRAFMWNYGEAQAAYWTTGAEDEIKAAQRYASPAQHVRYFDARTMSWHNARDAAKGV